MELASISVVVADADGPACRRRPLSPHQIALPVVKALAYLHARGVLHRDIKPENLVVTAEGVTKLCDFGLTINVLHEKPASRAGTLDFMARARRRPPPPHATDAEELAALLTAAAAQEYDARVTSHQNSLKHNRLQVRRPQERFNPVTTFQTSYTIFVLSTVLKH